MVKRETTRGKIKTKIGWLITFGAFGKLHFTMHETFLEMIYKQIGYDFSDILFPSHPFLLNIEVRNLFLYDTLFPNFGKTKYPW